MSRTNTQWICDLQSDDPFVSDNATMDLQSRIRQSIFSQFLNKGLTGHCIEDVVQETTIRIFQRLESFRAESHFTTWATAFAVRTGLEMLRRGFWAARTHTDFFADTDKVDLTGAWQSQAPGPQQSAQQAEVLELLTKAINEILTFRQRCALVREMQGLPVAKIATEMGTTRGAIYKLTHDARKKLKQVLENAGHDGDAIRELFFSSQ
jgi:RNA polymerase sigma-70 factor (ECF subfamily)